MENEDRNFAQKIVAIACAKNEYDVIEAFARHSLAFVDTLIVLDNGSTDGTLKLLHDLADRFAARLEVMEDPSPGDWQSDRMTRLMKKLAVDKHGADWIVCLDADEFVEAESPGCFRRALAAMNGPVSIEWRTYVPQDGDDGRELNPVLRVRHCLLDETKKFFKVIVPGSLASEQGLQIAMGNHNLTRDGTSPEMTPIGSARLAHFPIRDLEQFKSKIALTTLQFLAMHEKNPAWGIHLRRYWQDLCNPQRIAEAYWTTATRYGIDPEIPAETGPIICRPFAYRGGPLTVTVRRQNSDHFLGNLLGYAEALAASYAGLQKDHEKLKLDCQDLLSRLSAFNHDYEKLVASRAYRLSRVIRAVWIRLRRICKRNGSPDTYVRR